MIEIGKQFRIPLFNNWLVEVIEINKVQTVKFDDFTMKFLEGPFTDQTFKCKVLSREQDSAPSASHRIKVRVTEGPAPIIGTERWIDPTDFI